jgi:hypothetical protein
MYGSTKLKFTVATVVLPRYRYTATAHAACVLIALVVCRHCAKLLRSCCPYCSQQRRLTSTVALLQRRGWQARVGVSRTSIWTSDFIFGSWCVSVNILIATWHEYPEYWVPDCSSKYRVILIFVRTHIPPVWASVHVWCAVSGCASSRYKVILTLWRLTTHIVVVPHR